MGSRDDMTGSLPYVQAPRDGTTHTHTIILLHGRGSTAPEFAKELFESQASLREGEKRTLPDLFPSVRWVFPQSGMSKAYRFGTQQTQWFDIWSIDDREDDDQSSHMQIPGLRQSITHIVQTVAHEARIIPMHNIFLGGISQGCAAALSAFLATSKKVHRMNELAGLIGISGWMPPVGVLDALSARDPSSPHRERMLRPVFTPILLGHAEDDPVVDVKLGRRMRDRLNAFACDVTLHEYKEGEHWVNEPKGIDDIAAFIRERMAQQGGEGQKKPLELASSQGSSPTLVAEEPVTVTLGSEKNICKHHDEGQQQPSAPASSHI